MNMGENPNYWWSSNGKLPPPTQQPYPTFLSPLQPPPVAPPPSFLNPPYLFGSSLLLPVPNSNSLADHHHQNQDFPVSWSQLLMSGLASEEEQSLNSSSIRLGHGHVGEIKHGFLDQQINRQVYYNHKGDHQENNSNDDDLQACSSSWSSQLNPIQSGGSTSSSMSTFFDFSSKIDRRNQYSSQCDDTSTSGASKKARLQSSSTQLSPMPCNDTITTGTPKRARAQPSSTHTSLKVRKEKLSDRISALHQLVSPFGKTDTASVLLEATAHIRFLEGQIEALTSPYVSGNTRHQHSDGNSSSKDLLSRGLCLVPVTCIDHIDATNMTDNGAEFWTPALGGGF